MKIRNVCNAESGQAIGPAARDDIMQPDRNRFPSIRHQRNRLLRKQRCR
jgi:hypothetical protein